MMTLAEDFKVAAAVGGVILAGLVPYLELRMRKVFATREDLDGVGRRVGSVETKAERLEELAEGNQRRLDLNEQAAKADRERLTETVAEPLREIRAGMIAIQETLTSIRVEHGQKIAQHDRDLSALGRGMDDVRDRVGKLENRMEARG